MANEKIIKSRQQQKHDIEANWLKATNFIPKEGEIIIYDPETWETEMPKDAEGNPLRIEPITYFRIKVGDGATVVSELPFAQGVGRKTDEGGEIFCDYDNNTAGLNGHAEGEYTQAKWRAHSEGYLTIANNTAHAEGRLSKATGKASHAEGIEIYNDIYKTGTKTFIITTQPTHIDENIIVLDYDVTANLPTANYGTVEGLKVGDYIALGTTDTATGFATTDCKRITAIQVENSNSIITLHNRFRAENYYEGHNCPEDGYIPAGARLRYIVPTESAGQASHAEGTGSSASGQSSHAEGEMTIASGAGSHAEGRKSEASGSYSHAEGNLTISSGRRSHAEGESTIASGDFSHAEGIDNKATGRAAHAEGINTQATSYHSHAEGEETIASGQDSHAEGRKSVAQGHFSHAEGNFVNGYKKYYVHEDSGNLYVNDVDFGYEETQIPAELSDGCYVKAYRTGDEQLSSDVVKLGLTYDSESACAHLTFTPNLNFVPQYIQRVYLNHSRGQGSHAEGAGNEARADYSHVEGRANIATSTDSHVQGKWNMPGDFAHIIGGGKESARKNIHTVDWNGNAVYDGEVTASNGRLISSEEAHNEAESVLNDWLDGTEWSGVVNKLDTKLNAFKPVATGSFSLGRKSGTTAGVNSFAVGENVTANGINSHAEGYQTTATKNSSHAEGYGSDATNDAAHAEGFETTASGHCAHAEGRETKAIASRSHAEGYLSEAQEYISHAEGYHSIASGDIQHVQGQFNIVDSGSNTKTVNKKGKYAHIVGNGTSDATRSNAHTLDWDGNAWFAGEVTAANGKLLGEEETAEIAFAQASSAITLFQESTEWSELLEGQWYGYTVITNRDSKNWYSKINIQTILEHWPKVYIHKIAYFTDPYYPDQHYPEETIFLPYHYLYDNDGETYYGEEISFISGDIILKATTSSYWQDDCEFTLSSIQEELMTKENPTGTGSFSLNRKANTTIGDYSFAEGQNTVASGPKSHAEGTLSKATANSSHAEGYNTNATADASHSEGFETHATGHSSHAEGRETTAEGVRAHAEGFGCYAKGINSHAEGEETEALNQDSHAEGRKTKASAAYAHAEGWETEAAGQYAHAEGRGTIANCAGQHVQGKWNIKDILRDDDGNPILDADGNEQPANKYAHIVGNGNNNDGTITRSNAHTLDWNGNAWYSGSVRADKGIVVNYGTSLNEAPTDVPNGTLFILISE